MNFYNINVLWHLLWILPLISMVYFYANNKRNNILKIIFGARFNSNDYVIVSKSVRVWRFIIFNIIVFLLIIALAQPRWGEKLIPYSSKGRDVMILLDTSKSMLSRDIKPSRLEHSKWFIRSLMQENKDNRFGLIAFAGSSFLECPLTLDQTSFFQILDELDTDSIPIGGTNIQKALERTLSGLEASESNHRAVVLISDGDELEGRGATVIEKFSDMNILIFVVGVGDPNQPGFIELFDKDGKNHTFLRDSQGEIVKSKLNEKQLIDLSAKGKGVYVRSTAIDTGLDVIKKNIKDLIPKEFDSGKQIRPIERFHFPLIGCFFFLFIWLILTERPRKRKTQVIKVANIAVLIFTISFMGQAEENSKKQEKNIIKDNDDPIELYNQALELQTKGENSQTVYEKAIANSADNPQVRARSYQNLGVKLHKKMNKDLKENLTPQKMQNLDELSKKLNGSLSSMNNIEELYTKSLEYGINNSLLKNQQLLVNDRTKIEYLKRIILSYQDKLKDAQKETKQALEEQKKVNKQQQSQNIANMQRDKASKSVAGLKTLAKKVQQQGMLKNASAAENELKLAKNEQLNNQGMKAEQHIKKALDYLMNKDKDKKDKDKQNKDKQNKDKKDNKDNKDKKDKKEKKDKQNQDKKKQEDKKDKQLPKQDKKQKQTQKEKKKIDPQQAKVLLELMANGEKKLRKELKGRQKANAKDIKVDKNW